MHRAILVVSMVMLVPASAFAYINAGFKSAAEYRQHLRQQYFAKLGRATEAIQRNPRDAVAYLYRANLYARDGWDESRCGRDYDKALVDLDKAIELDPKFVAAYFRRGQVRLWVIRVATPDKPTPLREADALADVEKATQLDPTLVEAQVFFAVNTKDLTKAIRAAERACEHTKYKGEICLQLLASLHAQNGDFDKAVHWQQKALELDVFGVNEARKRLENYRNKKPNDLPIHWFMAKYEVKRIQQGP
jgi:tetratricopeptide (TPR) repeat protein